MRDEEKTVKCKYLSCLHETRDVIKSEAVKKGNSYYHKDCLRTQEEIKEIIDLFKNNINPNPVYSQLQNVIKNIVFTKGLGSSFLLFGLKYYIQHKIPLNYPQGLYYVIQNKDVINSYNKEKAKKIKNDINNQSDNIGYSDEDNNRNFGYVAKKENTIIDMIGV